MNGVHEDGVGSQYLRPNYRRGSIIRDGDDWCVVTKQGSRYNPWPVVTRWQQGSWTTPEGVRNPHNCSAPFVHTYEGIPDEVRAKATALMLTKPTS